MNLRRLLVSALAVLAASAATTRAEDTSLRSAFLQPSNQARPWAWWFWIDGHISADGLRKDLAEMQAKGFGGINLFNVSRPGPKGPVRYMSREWLDLVKQVGNDAKQRGFPFVAHEAAGWSGSGGPWVKVEDSMQILTWTEAHVEANGGPVATQLARPEATRDYYRDIAVLAFPTPTAEAAPALPKPVVTPIVADKPSRVLEFEYPQPVTAATLTWYGRHSNLTDWLTVEALGDEGAWHTLIRFDGVVYNGVPTVTASFAPYTAKRWRVRAEQAPFTAAPEFVLSAAPRLFNWEFKAAFQLRWGHDGGARPTPPESEGPAAAAAAIDPAQIRDISSALAPDGRLSWTPPGPGRWTVVRLGHTFNGAMQNPAPAGGTGLQPDSLSPSGKAAAEVFKHSVDRLLAPDGAGLRGKLTGVESDSWEFKTENWTDGLREEFQRRCGYDPLPWLIVSAGGHFVGSPERSEAFLWDMRRVLADLLAENYYGKLHQAANARGLKYFSEASGAQQFLYDGVNYLRPSDVPMGENWFDDGMRADCKVAASAAQLYGQQLVGCETFTGSVGRWLETPFLLKQVADRGFVAGINLLIIHNYTHQPSDGPGPGFTLGKYGINDNRLNTWWPQSGAFHDYLARCSAVLQQGRTVSDVLYMLPEDIPSGLSYQRGPWHADVPGVLPNGYDFTVCSAQALRDRVTVKDGRYVLPNGAQFRLLVLANRTALTPETLTLIGKYVRAGGIVVGPKPTHSPSLRGWPESDHRVRQLADEIWGDCDGVKALERAYGQGRIFAPQALAAVLRAVAVAPDLAWTNAAPDAIGYIHRRTEQSDVYFVHNRTDAPLMVDASFRVSDAVPELWDAESGTTQTAPVYRSETGRTVVPLALSPGGSLFVVLARAAPPTPHVTALRGPTGSLARLEASAPGRYEMQLSNGANATVEIPGPLPTVRIEGAWDVSFKALGREPFRLPLPNLISWPDSTDERVKYFSGTATYTRTINVPDALLAGGNEVYLDLGAVDVVAEVKLNGQELGTLWTPPYRVNVTRSLRRGANAFEVRVTNTWINRLIGDEQLPEDVAYNANGAMLKWPEWLKDGKPRSTARQTFSFWRQYRANSPLVPAGLRGPVVLQAAKVLKVPSETTAN